MLIKGDIWDHFQNYNAICCTCNEITTRKYIPFEHNELVMGAGIALAFKKKFPDLPRIWGDRIIELEKRYGHKPLMIVTNPGILFKTEKRTNKSDWFAGKHPQLVYFKTKYHWKDPSPIELIEKSMAELCDNIEDRGWLKVLLPMPGVGLGGIPFDDVYSVLKPYLDDYKEIDIIVKD